MNNKEEIILKEIINYVNDNYRMPTMRYLQKRLLYKSINSIKEYINSLERQNYLIRNKENKLILNNYSKYYQTGLKTIKIINSNQTIHLILNKSDKYIAYKINHDYFNNIGVFHNDILIIKKINKIKDNELGLFIIDNKYRVMKYQYRDGFYILSDKEELVLNRINLIGKVIMLEKYFK